MNQLSSSKENAVLHLVLNVVCPIPALGKGPTVGRKGAVLPRDGGGGQERARGWHSGAQAFNWVTLGTTCPRIQFPVL